MGRFKVWEWIKEGDAIRSLSTWLIGLVIPGGVGSVAGIVMSLDLPTWAIAASIIGTCSVLSSVGILIIDLKAQYRERETIRRMVAGFLASEGHRQRSEEDREEIVSVLRDIVEALSKKASVDYVDTKLEPKDDQGFTKFL